MKIIFVRHAESEKNIGDKFDKSDDENDYLTQEGEKQIIKTANYLKKILLSPINSILLSGNRKRSVDSGIVISNLLKCPFLINNGLQPINPGELKGLLYNDALKKYSELMRMRKLFSVNLISGYALKFPKGDSLINYEKKIKKCLNDIKINYNNFNNIIIITHRSVILAALNIYNKILGKRRK